MEEYLPYLGFAVVVIGALKVVFINDKDTKDNKDKISDIIDANKEQVKINSSFSTELKVLKSITENNIKTIESNNSKDEERDRRVNEMAQGLKVVETILDINK